jgi:hypothetical protein
VLKASCRKSPSKLCGVAFGATNAQLLRLTFARLSRISGQARRSTSTPLPIPPDDGWAACPEGVPGTESEAAGAGTFTGRPEVRSPGACSNCAGCSARVGWSEGLAVACCMDGAGAAVFAAGSSTGQSLVLTRGRLIWPRSGAAMDS